MVVAQHLVAEAAGKGEEGVWHEGDSEEGAHHSAAWCSRARRRPCGRGAGVALGRGSSDVAEKQKSQQKRAAEPCTKVFARFPPEVALPHPCVRTTRDAAPLDRPRYLRCPELELAAARGHQIVHWTSRAAPTAVFWFNQDSKHARVTSV